jgi:ribosomal protein L29
MSGAGTQGDAELDRQVAELREELRMLRAQDALDSGRVPSSKPTPPTEV